MAWGFFELLAGFSAIASLVYYYLSSTFSTWSSRGVPGPKPTVFYGTCKDLILSKINIADFSQRMYNKFSEESFIGIYQHREPVLIVKDPKHIIDVLIKDFPVFADRGVKFVEKVEPLSQHLFSLEPKRWRPLRHILSPTFTSGKLKQMFHLLTDCSKHLEQFLEKCIEQNPVMECREFTAKFTTDVIGVCAFGLQINALSEEDNVFRKFGRKIFFADWRLMLKRLLRQISPKLIGLLKPVLYDKEMNEFFINTVVQTMNHRKKNNIRRGDFIDLLLDIKNDPNRVDGVELTDELLTAQVFIFFIAGFETSSTTMSNALLELANNPSIQHKLRDEINEKLATLNGAITYESIKDMKYLHKIFTETLRKYPPVSVLTRKSQQAYTFAESKVTIPAGTLIWIPNYAIQRDPKIYPDPEKFDPERFDEENKKSRHPAFYLPFGDGPRNCIGARFANYQTKVGLITIIRNYQVETCEKTQIPYVNDPKSFLLAPLAGIYLKFVKI